MALRCVAGEVSTNVSDQHIHRTAALQGILHEVEWPRGTFAWKYQLLEILALVVEIHLLKRPAIGSQRAAFQSDDADGRLRPCSDHWTNRDGACTDTIGSAQRD